MKFLDEYRDKDAVHRLLAAIDKAATRPWTLMEVCGGQTHAFVRHGLDAMLPARVELLHGPGCPVCVTSLSTIDKAHAIAARDGVMLCSFGDMLRVPGSRGDLLSLKSQGRDIRVVYSPLDAVRLAAENPSKQVVFFAIGFETTAPANATAVRVAKARGLKNFSALVAHVLVPPALAYVLQAPGNRVQGFLGPGHVCTVMGTHEYEAVSARYRVPIVVAGFEPVDLLDGILRAVRQLERGEARVENAYARVVKEEGNARSRELIEEVFDVVDRRWRGVGILQKSGLRLSASYRDHDAERRFEVEDVDAPEPAACIAGLVLQGLKRPTECAAFGTSCTPESPLGATMVSNEGACAAYYLYRIRRRDEVANAV